MHLRKCIAKENFDCFENLKSQFKFFFKKSFIEILHFNIVFKIITQSSKTIEKSKITLPSPLN